MLGSVEREAVLAHLRAAVSKGGQRGGRARAEKLGPERLQEAAYKMNEAREAKRRARMAKAELS